ncbi:MAG: fluoride efflux transporter CrcB [Anaerolineaceae bacterium]
MEKFLIISLGAVLGANTRYWVSDWAARKLGSGFPYGTLIINITGSLLLGFFLTLATEKLALDPRWRLLIAIGFFGSYTTFSTYTYESLNLMLGGQWLPGLANLLGSAAVGILAAAAGMYLGKLI